MNVKVEFPEFVPWWLQIALSLMIVVALLYLYFYSCLWTMQDATQRGKSGCLIGMLVFLTWPLGLLIWLAARPNRQIGPPPLPRSDA